MATQLLAHLCYLPVKFIFIATSHKHYTFTTSYVLFGNLSLFATQAMVMRPKQAETAVHGCQQSGSLFFLVDLRVNARYQCGHSALFVASSQQLARLCYLHLTLVSWFSMLSFYWVKNYFNAVEMLQRRNQDLRTCWQKLVILVLQNTFIRTSLAKESREVTCGVILHFH